MTTPTPGDIYAVYVPEAGRWRAYQYLRTIEPKANKIGCIEFLPFEGWFDRPEAIAPETLVPSTIDLPEPNSPEIRNVRGRIPPDHVLIAQHPPLTDDKAISYGGGDINDPFWVPDALLVEPRENYSDELYVREQVWDLLEYAKENPQIRSLTLRSARIRRFDALGQLAELRSLTLFDCMLDDGLLPNLTTAPRLNLLWIHNFPHAPGTELKKQAKVLPQLSCEITGLRTSEWYAANRNNPFAEWPDLDYLPKGMGKKAVALYKDTQKRALAMASSATLQADMEALAHDWAEAFNQLEEAAGKPWIETFHREIICDAFHAIATLLAEKSGKALQTDKLQASIDAVRNW